MNRITLLLLGFTLLLVTACDNSGTTRTQDPMLMTINERTIWELENYKNEVNEMAVEAAEMAAEDLDPLIWHINSLAEEIKDYKVPLFAVKAQSALYNFADSTYSCYSYKHQEYMRKLVGDETITEVDYSICDQAQEYEESFDLLLQELKDDTT